MERPVRVLSTAPLASALLASALLSATCSDARRRATKPPPPKVPVVERVPVPPDLGARAYHHIEKLVGFGPRFPGSPGWHSALDYIAGTLRAATGREPVRDRWTDDKSGLTLENITLTLPGHSEHRLVLGCHHDTKKCQGHPDPEHNFQFVGANDSGSGVGLLLAMAADLRDWDGEASLELAFFDGEESIPFKWDENQALFGSRHFVARERLRQLEPGVHGKVRAMVLLDMVGACDLQIDDEEYSDRDLHDIFRAAARACGHADVFFQKSMAINDDHKPFLDVGIPAIDLIDLVHNEQWHTAQDDLAHVSAESLQIVGEVVLTALPAIVRRYFPAPGKLDLPRRH